MSNSILSKSIKTCYKGIYKKETKKGTCYIARYTVNKKTKTQIVGYEHEGITEYEAYKMKIQLSSSSNLIEALETNYDQKYDIPTLFKKFTTFREPYLAKNTISNYNSIFNKYISVDFKYKDIRSVTRNDLQLYINKLLTYLRPATAEKIVYAFKKFYIYLQDNGIYKYNMASSIMMPKYDNKKYFSITKKDVKRLIHYIMNINNQTYKTLYCMLLHGRRINELLQLKWIDIDFASEIYHLNYKNTKTKKNQYYYLEDFQLKELINLRKLHLDSIYVFENPNTKLPLTYTSFFRIHKKLRKELNMIDFNIHSIRHMTAFLLVNNGYSLEITAKILGHQSIQSTSRYAVLEMNKAKDAYSKTFKQLIKI
ncbi:tyrosine-type recombinase/integrase [Arcobacter sp.]|uniref:tyrosine-type recombinase/integrase n=1 Tax=unclassified Arcobacter TaxID=2593671 RepID=UPI003B00B3C7